MKTHKIKKIASKLLLAALLAPGFFPVTTQASPEDNLAVNGNFEKDGDADQWPDGWGTQKDGISWGEEKGNHFLKLTSSTPGTTVMLYQEFKIPAGAKTIEMSWKQRVTDLKKGTSPWFDARIMLEFTDENRVALPGKPKAPNAGKDTHGWEEKSVKFDVPAGSVFLKFMPSLLQVESGTFELDDLVVKVD
jgi:hypothetical protein